MNAVTRHVLAQAKTALDAARALDAQCSPLELGRVQGLCSIASGALAGHLKPAPAAWAGAKTITVTYCGIELECSYDYTPAEQQTWENPGYPETADLISCEVGGVDISEILGNDQREAIESLILEGRANQAEYEACEYADRVRDERRPEAA